MPEPSNRGVHFPEPQHKQADQGTLGVIKDRAQDMASGVADTAQKAWEGTREGAQKAWDSTREGVENAASYVGNTAEEAFDSVTGFIRRYPVACVMGGFFVGLLAAGVMGGGPDRLRYNSR